MTNTITKITYDGNDYKVGEGYTAGTGINISASNQISNSGVTSVNSSTGDVTVQATLVSGTNIKTVNSNSLLGSGNISINAVPSGGTDGQVLSKVSGNVAWANVPSDQVQVSTQAHNLLTSGMKIWCGTEGDYGNLGTYDNNSLYLTVPGGASGWQPSANTIAYYPLDTDFDDASGNGYDLTATNVTITTLDGVDCAYYTAGKAINTSAPVGTVRTLSAWVYNITTTGNPVIIGTGESQSSFYGMFLVQFSGVVNISDLHAQSIAGSSISQNAWHHLVAVNDNTTMKIYIDGTLVNSGTHTRTDSSTGISVGGVPFTDQYNQDCTGYISNAIVESVAWSDQDVSDYYDQTKGNYGIS